MVVPVHLYVFWLAHLISFLVPHWAPKLCHAFFGTITLLELAHGQPFNSSPSIHNFLRLLHDPQALTQKSRPRHMSPDPIFTDLAWLL